jgi:protoporphyrinogen oxidase
MTDEYLIIGAGPTGLGAAWRFEQLGVSWQLFEATAQPGGLSSSFESDGFTWDLGGHVVFSHYEIFDRLLDSLLAPEEWIQHERRAFIRTLDRWVPYPFQNNTHYLPAAEREECLAGLREASQHPSEAASTFRQWIDQFAGRGIARLFLHPYNYKVWAYPPDMLSAHWLEERVARPDIEKLSREASKGASNSEWGPNRSFRFPRRGGTGAIWRKLAESLPPGRLHYGCPAVGVDVDGRRLTFANGHTESYDRLINTMPLDRFLHLSPLVDLAAESDRLLHNSVFVVGVGLRGRAPSGAADKTWLYFPEEDVPFYRVTVFSNYSPHNVPTGCYSLMAEIAESPRKPAQASCLVGDCIRGMTDCRLIGADNEVVHTWQRHLEYGYPVPSLERDEILGGILPVLEEKGILSRGRFGAWKYEVGNMDHCFAQGLEAADLIAEGKPEITLHHPDLVNRATGADRFGPGPRT